MKHYMAIIPLALLFFSGCEGKPELPQEFRDMSSAELSKKGLEFHRQQDFESSLRFFQYAAARDENNYKAYFNQACANSLLGKASEAYKALTTAAELNRKWVVEHLRDPDLKAVISPKLIAEGSVSPALLDALYGEYAPFIEADLECEATSDVHGGPGKMTRRFTFDGKVRGTDFPDDFHGSTMTAYDFKGGSWEVADDKLLVRERVVLTWTSIAVNADAVGTESINERTFESPEKLKELFSKSACDIRSTY